MKEERKTKDVSIPLIEVFSLQHEELLKRLEDLFFEDLESDYRDQVKLSNIKYKVKRLEKNDSIVIVRVSGDINRFKRI